VTTSEQKRRMGRPRSRSCTRSMAAAELLSSVLWSGTRWEEKHAGEKQRTHDGDDDDGRRRLGISSVTSRAGFPLGRSPLGPE
jgi:hypothetical protein